MLFRSGNCINPFFIDENSFDERESYEDISHPIISDIDLKITEKERKIIESQEKYIKELFDIPICFYCKKTLETRSAYYTKGCGHTFHKNCVREKTQCTECDSLSNYS